MNSVAEIAIQGQRNTLMSEAFAEIQYRKDTIRQQQFKSEEDERQHAEQLISILSQGQAETVRVRCQLTQEGEQSSP